MIDKEPLLRVAKEYEKEDREDFDRFREHPDLVKWTITEVTILLAIFVVFVIIATRLTLESVGWAIEGVLWLAFIAVLAWEGYLRRRMKRPV